MKKKILLIYPEFPATYWSYKYTLSFVNKKTMMPPLGLLTIASLLPEDYEIKLIDMNISELDAADIKSSDLVFISSMIVQKDSFEHAVKLCNACGVPVVAGGPYPTSSFEKITGVDFFILNEAEITLPLFLSDYEKGSAKKIYTDTTKPEITLTPLPRFDLINVNDYMIMSLQFSRGCPFSCEFCDIIEMFGRIPRTKLPEQFIREIDAVYKTGFRGPIFIVDDNFIGNKQKVKILLKHIIEWQIEHDFPFTIFTEASINIAADDELMDLMFRANFDMVFIGIETPDPATLQAAYKNQNAVVDLLASVKKIQARGLEVCAGFIIGFDTDPENIFDLQIDFIQKAGIPIAMIGLMMALPNTQLHRRLQSENRLLHDTSGNNTHDLKVNFITRMPLEKIVAGYKHVISELYSPEKYFERSFVLIKDLSAKSNWDKPLTWPDIKALFRSLFLQGFSRYGFIYFKFLFKTLRFNYKKFPKAVDLAIKGYHFFKITAELLASHQLSTAMEDSMILFDEKIANFHSDKSSSEAKIISRHIIKSKKKIKRRYANLSGDSKKHSMEQFIKFEKHCDNSLLIINSGNEGIKILM